MLSIYSVIYGNIHKHIILSCIYHWQFIIILLFYFFLYYIFIYFALFFFYFFGKKRLLWMSFICIAIFGTIAISQRTWIRFQTSPVVISMDRNMFFWNTSFPSLTVCPHRRIDEEKLELYIA